MGTLLLYLVLGLNALVSLVQPWIGAVLAYLVAVLTPHNIWWWAFQDLRPLLWVLVPTLVGFVLAVFRGVVDFSGFNTRLNFCVFALWLGFTVSFYCGPYVWVYNDYRFYDPDFMFSSLQKTYITYFVAVALIDNQKKLKFLAATMVLTTLYMIYWANDQYFFQGRYGRMHGPVPLGGYSIYSDENNFAVLFVTGLPFLFYFCRYISNKLVAYGVLLFIPFGWHAIFLTGSRGALLGTAAVLLVFLLRSEKKFVGLLVMLCFVGAFAWQAGSVMKSRSLSMASQEEDTSSTGRIDAWKAAIAMMLEHPITGVGFASFGQAFPDFSDKTPRIAHNTFFQIGGEWGIACGITYLVLVFSTLGRLGRNGKRLRGLVGTEEGRLHYCLNEACLLALTGFFVCSLFLSLEKYEIFYYLLLVANRTLVGSARLADPGVAASVNGRQPFIQPPLRSPPGGRPGRDGPGVADGFIRRTR